MPKPVKLHGKGKPNSIQKPTKVNNDYSDNNDPEESTREFQLQLCWCIQQLERSLKEKKGNEKQLQESWKVLTVLKNNNQPIIRKRQLMRTHFGDYRAKMAAEEKKLAKMTSKIKISENPTKPKAIFLRKSIFQSTGNNSFRFNFDVPQEKESTENISIKEDSPVNVIDNNENAAENQASTNASNNENLDDSNKVTKENREKQFKFTFSSTGFKFNFDVDNS
ncbi:UPF0488 protein CG14286 [Battus philenor]|uniref:UPF0488 protein CG14286 n=1 Tax=Battus philenor TaxID=42288 RepID=UPI0035D01630